MNENKSHATWSTVMAIMAIIFKALPDKPFLCVNNNTPVALRYNCINAC